MILIGQYDSPFVRRVAIALHLYGLSYEHRPWSVWADADKLPTINPLMRVPTLVLDEGEVLVDSAAVLDAVDEMVARPLLPRSGSRRRQGLKICALATGAADKTVSLFYEPLLRSVPSEKWMERCRRQIETTFDVLEAERPTQTDWWLGSDLSHADIAVACALRFTRESHAKLFHDERWPKLAAHARACEAMPVFRHVCQPLQVAMK